MACKHRRKIHIQGAYVQETGLTLDLVACADCQTILTHQDAAEPQICDHCDETIQPGQGFIWREGGGVPIHLWCFVEAQMAAHELKLDRIQDALAEVASHFTSRTSDQGDW